MASPSETVCSTVDEPAIKKSRRKPGPHTRSRHGCDTCKNRKLKCGEEQPECNRCRKNNLDCTYTVPERPRRKTSSPKSEQSLEDEKNLRAKIEELQQALQRNGAADNSAASPATLCSRSVSSIHGFDIPMMEPANVGESADDNKPPVEDLEYLLLSMDGLRDGSTPELEAPIEATLPFRINPSPPQAYFISRPIEMAGRPYEWLNIMAKHPTINTNRAEDDELNYYLEYFAQHVTEADYGLEESTCFINGFLTNMALQDWSLLYAVVSFAAYLEDVRAYPQSGQRSPRVAHFYNAAYVHLQWDLEHKEPRWKHVTKLLTILQLSIVEYKWGAGRRHDLVSNTSISTLILRCMFGELRSVKIPQNHLCTLVEWYVKVKDLADQGPSGVCDERHPVTHERLVMGLDEHATLYPQPVDRLSRL